MDHSIYLFVDDLVAEGAAVVTERLQGLGVDRATLALSYHRARDVTPHSPQRVTLRHDGLHVRADGDLFGEESLPASVAGDRGEAAIADLRAAGIAVDGWVVTCHSTTIGLAHPEVTQLSCFGARSAPADLCPSQPRVRRYVTDLAVAAARAGVDRVVAESLHFGHFGHGYHHERSFVRLGPLEDLLLGWCFCEACAAATRAHGGDPERARTAAVRHLEGVLAGDAPASQAAGLDDLVGLDPSFGVMVQARTATVASLVAQVARAVSAEGSRLAFIDLSGAVLGYADGRPAGVLAADRAWQSGIDPEAVAQHADYVVLAYASDPARVGADLGRYRELVGDAHLRAVLRPSAPDTTDAVQLGERVRAAAAHADGVDFYHYALATLADLARIPAAIGAV
jgi:hypothetical protein